MYTYSNKHIVFIADAPGLRIFGFHANVNKPIGPTQYGDIAGDVFSARNGRWTFETSTVQINTGDVLNYWIYAQADGTNHKKQDQRWTYSRKITYATLRSRVKLTMVLR